MSVRQQQQQDFDKIANWLQAKGFETKNLPARYGDGTEMAKLINTLWPNSLVIENFKKCTHISAKTSNWFRLYDILKRHGIRLSVTQLDGIACEKPGCIEHLLDAIMVGEAKATPRLPRASDSLGSEPSDDMDLQRTSSDEEFERKFNATEQKTIFELAKEMRI